METVQLDTQRPPVHFMQHTLTREVLNSMKEDVEITKKIIQVYADEEYFPSRMALDDLRRALAQRGVDVTPDQLAYHLVCAIDAGLFLGEGYEATKFYLSIEYTIGRIDGLHVRGSDYYHESQSSLWDKAKQALQERAIPLTTKAMAPMLTEQLKNAISGS